MFLVEYIKTFSQKKKKDILKRIFRGKEKSFYIHNVYWALVLLSFSWCFVNPKPIRGTELKHPRK